MIATATELLKKYDVPGPRYTSYPTVLYWDRNPTADEWVASLGAGLDEVERLGEGAAVYVHVPFCRSLCTYCGCNSRITQNASVGLPYVRTVLKEWGLYRRLLGREKKIPLSEMHFGGGTPTYLSPPELEELVGGILAHVERAPDAEFSVESDPRVTLPEHLSTLAPGSTLLGTMLGKALNRRREDGEAAVTPSGQKGEPKQRRRMVAPLHGMGDVTGRLQRRLSERLGERFRRGEAVTEIPAAPNVILATPAYVSARLLAGEAPALADALGRVSYTPVVSVTAFVPVSAFARPVRGVGVLVPPREGRKCLGVLFNSSAFEGRVFDESRFASFTVLFGGTSQPGWVDASDEEIGRAVAEELDALLGIRGGASELVINRRRRAIPQYSTALPAVWRAARETWCGAPGRMLFGNYTGQVSLRGMIERADALGV